MSWILPPSASTFAGDIDFLYYVILVITGIAFVVVEVAVAERRTRCGRQRGAPGPVDLESAAAAVRERGQDSRHPEIVQCAGITVGGGHHPDR